MVSNADSSAAGEVHPSPLAPLDRWTVASRLFTYFRPQWMGLLLASAAFIAGAATEPLIPLLLKIALDEGFIAEPSFPLWMVPVALVGLFAVRGVLSFIGIYLLSRSASRAVLSMREAMAGVLLRADAMTFVHMSPSLAVVKVINDTQSVSKGLTGACITILRDGSTAIALLAYLFWQNWQLTLLSLLSVPVLGLAVRAVHRRIVLMSKAGYESHLKLATSVEDFVRAWRVIRAFGAQEHEKARFDKQARQTQRFSLKSAAASALLTPFSQLISSVGVALIVTVALYQAQSGQASVGSFVGYVTALLLMVSKTRHLTDVSQLILNALAPAHAICELLDTPSEPDQGQRRLDRAKGEIRLEHVSFTYPSAETPALRDLTLHVHAGGSIALMGPSGAGKTTVIHLLLRFFRSQSGQIFIDGYPIEEYSLVDLRRQFAVVSQDIVLFDGSIAANVAYAQPFDESRIETCLRAAALWEHVVGLPNGIHSHVGIDGSQLSGGQRQRLAIARALYKDAPIWILDEATSALDSESESAVRVAIQAQRGLRTLIVIAHQISAVQGIDRVMNLAPPQ